MGKKKKGAVCNNPVAMARAAGPPPISGPTIRDYLDRARPSLEEAAGIIAAQHSRKESGALAAYEEQLNEVNNNHLVAMHELGSRFLSDEKAAETYRQELKDRRSKLLGTGSSSKEKKRKKKKQKTRKREWSRSRSRSRSPISTPSPGHRDTKRSSSRHDHSKSSGHKKTKRHHRHKHSRHSSPSPKHSSEDEPGHSVEDDVSAHSTTSTSERHLASEDVPSTCEVQPSKVV